MSVFYSAFRIPHSALSGWFLSREVVGGIEASRDEPPLIPLWVERPGAALDDQLDLVRRVSGVVERAQAAADLSIRIVVVADRAHHRRLVDEIALGRAGFRRAVDAAAGAGVGLGDHRDGGDTGGGSDRVEHEDALKGLISPARAAGELLAIALQQRVVGNQGGACLLGDARLERAQLLPRVRQRAFELGEEATDRIHHGTIIAQGTWALQPRGWLRIISA